MVHTLISEVEKKPKPINPLKPKRNQKRKKEWAGPTWEIWWGTWSPKRRRVGFWGESGPQNGVVLGF